jgi:hypothetical protein
LLNSIDENSKIQILQEDRGLYIQGIPIGAALFKLLMSKTVVDTVVTTSKYRINLQNLDTYMVSVNSSIPDFNRHVKNNITGLKSRGEKSDELIVNLFRGYLAATDYKFTQYIERLQERYEEGETMEYATLMTLALNKYTVLKGKLEWGALSQDRQEIVALSANVQRLKDQNLRLKNNNQKKPAAPKSNKSNPSNKKNKKGTKSKKQDPWAWKKIPPKDGDAHQKQVRHPKSGILETYYWCPAHNAWTKHNPDPNHPDGCKKAKQQQQARNAGHPSAQQTNSMRAMAAVFDAAVADDEEEE